jgi:hypothetical protein
MSWRIRNPRARPGVNREERVTRVLPCRPRTHAGKKAQAGAALLCLSLVGFLFSACAATSQASASAASSPEIDAVLPSKESWTLFRLGGLRYARVPAASSAWADPSPSGLPPGVVWMTIPAPEGAFRPVQALSAARGYFYLVDAASSRLCLYDSAAGLISTFPLPERFTPFSAGRAAVFRGADGTFIFADYAAGEAWLYTDREGVEGERAWMLRARTKMPVGWRDCVQQPGQDGIACRSGGAAMRFDGALNRIPAGGARTGESSTLSGHSFPASRLTWDAATREWTLEGLSGMEGSFVPQELSRDTLAPMAPRVLFRFRPVRRALDPP